MRDAVYFSPSGFLTAFFWSFFSKRKKSRYLSGLELKKKHKKKYL